MPLKKDEQSQSEKSCTKGRDERKAPATGGPVSETVTTTEANGSVEYAGWLSDDVLLVAGRFPENEDSLEAFLICEEESVALEVRSFSCEYSGVISDSGSGIGKLFVICVPYPDVARGTRAQLKIRSAITSCLLDPFEVPEVAASIHMLVGRGLAGLDVDTRNGIMEFLISATIGQRVTSQSRRLSKNLFSIREALRERLPDCKISREQPQGINVEAILAIDTNAYYIRGWMHDADAEITHLTAVSPEGSRIELLQRVFRYPRPDVEELYGITPHELLRGEIGFLAYFETEAPAYLSSGWIIEMRNADGVEVEVTAPPVVRDVTAIRDMILRDISHGRLLAAEELLPKHIWPAINRVQDICQKMARVESVIQYGQPIDTPDVSIIVPLYGRIDFLEQQLAQFVHDRDICEADLIYVLDSPELAENLAVSAARLSRLYHVPFRVVILQQNIGFSGANNVGVSLARGRLLLLLNSDVLPDRPGWLSTMTAFYDANPGIGALGPKLLFEDDSLQHAGMYFSRHAQSNAQPIWSNEHYFKGLHRRLPNANIQRSVPAVTAACLMISKDLYQQVGGLRGIYVQGDYEDSDLCLRILEAGRENWYLPKVELYHLEGQSYPSTLRQLTRQYNAWLHTHLWNRHIEKVMA